MVLQRFILKDFNSMKAVSVRNFLKLFKKKDVHGCFQEIVTY